MNFRFAIGVALVAALTAPASASSFPRDPGQTFLDVQYQSYRSSTFIQPNGQYVPAGCTFLKHELSVYAEYGLTKTDTLTGQLPYDWLSCGGNTTVGFTDLELADDHNLHRGATTTFGVRLDAIVPMGYSIDANPRLGYGEPGVEADALYGGSIGKSGFYDTQTGVRWYASYPAAQFHTTGTVGYNKSGLLVYGQLDYETNISAGKTLTNIGQNPTIQTAYTALQGTVAATYKIAPFGSLFVSGTTLISGKNTGQGGSLNVGLWSTF